MDMNERAESAVKLKQGKYNCSQAAALSCADLVDVSPEILSEVSSGFGGGMGGMESVCGALSGVVIIAGLLNEGKGSTPVAKKILESFRKRSVALLCKDLRGIETGNVVCTCDNCVRNAIYALYDACPEIKELDRR